jgi:hypothetical protein
VVSTHAPAQLVLLPPQASVQAPSEQTWSAAQTWSHAPQCAGSLLGSTHSPAHDCSGGTQLTPHTLAWQAGLPLARSAQFLPHAPQLSRSVLRSTQAVPQGV